MTTKEKMLELLEGVCVCIQVGTSPTQKLEALRKLVELLPDGSSELENVDKMSNSLDRVIEQLQKSTKLLKTIDICKVLPIPLNTIIAEEFYAHALFNNVGGTYYISKPCVEKFVKAVNNRTGVIRTSEELINKVRDLGLFKGR